MRRALVVLLIGLLGCGGTTFRAVSNPGGALVTSGRVSFIQFTAIIGGDGTLVNVTVVTLVQGTLPQTFTFCGTQTGMFVLNTDMRVTYVPAPICANLLTVVRL